MKTQKDDSIWMQVAFSLASLSISSASPNPAVGAIIVSNNKVISSGRTQPYGHEHAEVMAIQSAFKRKQNLTETTLYVTLEPCCITKNTPACTNLIIQANIPRVVVAVLDPSKEMRGKSIQILREASISVTLLDSIEFLTNIIYTLGGFFERVLFKKTRIWYKWAQTKHGFLAPQKGKSGNISSENSRSFNFFLRRLFGVVSVSPGTIPIDFPQLNVRNWTNAYDTLLTTQNKLQNPLLYYYQVAYEQYLVDKENIKITKRIYLLPRISQIFSSEQLYTFVKSRTHDTSCNTSYITSTVEHQKICEQLFVEHNNVSSLYQIDQIEKIFFQSGYNNVYFESGPSFFNTLSEQQNINYAISFCTQATQFDNHKEGRAHTLSTSLSSVQNNLKRGMLVNNFMVLDIILIGCEQLIVLIHKNKLHQLKRVLKGDYS